MYDELDRPLRELALREPLAERARLMTGALVATTPNGIKQLRVVSVDSVNDEALIELNFFNTNYLSNLVARYTADRTLAKSIFNISGGSRIRAGGALGQVQVDISPLPAPASITMPAATKPVLLVRVKPVGDYSTYVLGVGALPGSNWRFDPLFSEISFKFRPGCFNTNCAPEWNTALPPLPEPAIDYLAKDYGSFRQTMIAAMMQRVPGWEPTSEADLDMVLAELFSVAADELSDYQDRVMNEAYIATARKRVSIARHARLMDYHIHQGSQASTWLALEIEHDAGLQKGFELQDGLKAWAGESTSKKESDNASVFMSRHPRLADQPHDAVTQTVHQYLNNIGLYTWSDTITTLKAGSTRADLKLYGKFYLDDNSAPSEVTTDVAAVEIQNLIRNEKIKYLLIEEHLNPETGLLAGRDPSRRQLLRLVGGNDPATAATALEDPVTGKWLVRVRWEKEDALRRDYCFRVNCPAGNAGTALGAVDNISLFHGNLVEVFHGREKTTIFKRKEKDKKLETDPSKPLEFYCEATRWGTVCRLPDPYLAYRNTPPGGDVAPISTLKVEISTSTAGVPDPWNEVPSLIHSTDTSEGGDHFVVETDENWRSLLRFGNGKNGLEFPDDALVTATYQYGEPLEGNVGADSIVSFDAATVLVPPASPPLVLHSCWNPFDVTNGRDREPMAEIIRRVPEAYRQRQLRAVTIPDYVASAEKIKGVSRAAAKYAWTGSWRTVHVAIDPVGSSELSDELMTEVKSYLNAVRLIGEDLEVRPPIFVPLEIKVVLCAKPEVWQEDIRFVLEQEFSDGWTPDGRMGFFHPDLWTFGQALHASQIIGRALKVEGVEHIVAKKTNPLSLDPPISVSIKRWNSPFMPVESLTQLNYNEIILVQNDPDHMERGFITFEVKGGRQ